MSPFLEPAQHVKAAAEALRLAHEKLPFEWREPMNLLQSSGALARVAEAMFEGKLRASQSAKRAMLTRHEAAGLMGSSDSLDGTDNKKALEKKILHALNASYSKRANKMERIDDGRIEEIVREALAKGDVRAVALQSRIPEDRLILWIQGGRKIKGAAKAVA